MVVIVRKMQFCLLLVGVCIDTNVIYQSILEKRPIVYTYRKRRNVMM